MKAIIVIISCLLLISGCAPSLTNPQEAFDAYQAAVNSNDYSAIKQVTTENFKTQMAAQGTDLKRIDEYFDKAGLKSASCKITFYEQIHPEKATIGCTGIYEYKDGRVEQNNVEQYFLLVKEEDGTWKIDEYKEKI